MKKFLIALAVVLALGVYSVYLPISFYPLNRAILKQLEKRLEAKIECRSLKIYPWRSFAAKGVTALGKGGFGLSADSVVLDYDLLSLTTGRLHVTCNLRDVNFYKTSTIMVSLTDLLQIKPLGNFTFNAVRGDLHVGKHDTLTQNLAFLSENIKIFGNATTDTENNITSLLYFFFSDTVIKEMPNELREVLLKKEEGSWYSLYVGITGNYREPLLNIRTEKFRMNIANKYSK